MVPPFNCEITLDPNGYEESVVFDGIEKTLSGDANSGIMIPVPKNPNENTIFVGWSLYSDANKRSEIVVGPEGGIYYPPKQEKVTLYAIWANKQITLTFKMNDSDTEDSIYLRNVYTLTNSLPKEVKLPEMQEKGVKYEFVGWSTSKKPSSDYKVGSSTIELPLSDTVYYAQWKKPVTVTWVDKDDIVLSTSELKAFDVVSFDTFTDGYEMNAHSVPVPKEIPGEYKYKEWQDENGRVIGKNAVVYETMTVKAVGGEYVDINYFNGEEECQGDFPNNYVGFTFNAPSIEIEDFAHWHLKRDGETILGKSTVLDRSFVDTDGAINVEAHKGTKVYITSDNISATQGNSGDKATSAYVILISGINERADDGFENFPRKNDYAPASVLYREKEGVRIPLIGLDGKFIAEGNSDLLDENGNLKADVDLQALKLSSKWSDPNKIGGKIIWKNIYTTKEDDIKFYDKDYNLMDLSSSFDEKGIFIGTNPTFYTGPDQLITDIAKSSYVIAYIDPDTNKLYKDGYSFDDKNDEGYDAFINSGLTNDSGATYDKLPDSYALTLFHEKQNGEGEKNKNTLGYYVNEIEKQEAGTQGWMLPTLKEIMYMEKASKVPDLVAYNEGTKKPEALIYAKAIFGNDQAKDLWLSSMLRNKGASTVSVFVIKHEFNGIHWFPNFYDEKGTLATTVIRFI